MIIYFFFGLTAVKSSMVNHFRDEFGMGAAPFSEYSQHLKSKDIFQRGTSTMDHPKELIEQLR